MRSRNAKNENGKQPQAEKRDSGFHYGVRFRKKGFDVILVGTMILLFGLMIFALVVVVYSIVWKFSQERSSRRLNRWPSGAGKGMPGSKNIRTRTARVGIPNSLAGDESADSGIFLAKS